MSDGYNGWKNRDTWQVALRIGNDEPTYLAVLDRFRYRYEPVGADDAEEFVRETFGNGSCGDVAWCEIARCINDLCEIGGKR